MKERDNSGTGLDLHIDFDRTTMTRGGLRQRLTAALRDAVREGRLAPGTVLPPIRSLAQDLGVARNTVGDAYAELVAEGWLTARQGSGTRVAERLSDAEPVPRTTAPEPAKPSLSLVTGSGDVSSFPRTTWLRSMRRAVTAAPSDAFGAADPRGRIELRRTLAEYLTRSRGIRTTAEEIVIVAGAAHAIELLATKLAGPVAVESYGLFVHRELFEAAGRSTVPLSVDRDGADTSELWSTEARVALLTPAHQFPTGGTLLPDRRRESLAWARATDSLLIEDDYDGEFRYGRDPVGALQGMDPQRVLYLGTTSKSLSPAIRIGWIVVPPHLVDTVLSAKGQRERWVNTLEQLALADFIESGRYDEHIRRQRLKYRRRRDRLVSLLAAHAPHVSLSGIAAGLHAVIPLPDGTEAYVVERARRQGLAIDGLSLFRHPASRTPHRDGIVVNYGYPPDHTLTATFESLVRAIG